MAKKTLTAEELHALGYWPPEQVAAELEKDLTDLRRHPNDRWVKLSISLSWKAAPNED